MTDKNAVPTKLLWLDLEMTGLDPQNDVILEVAAEITDFNFKTLANYESMIRHPRELVIERMQKNIWWADFPENSFEFISKLDKGKLSDQVEQDLVDLVTEHFGNERVVLAGNS